MLEKPLAKMTTKQLRDYLKEASIAAIGSRAELLTRYHAYQRRLLQQAGMVNVIS